MISYQDQLMHKLLFTFFLILISFSSWCQEVQFEIGTGAEVGWWVYNRGSHSKEIFNTEGWDRSHLSLSTPINFSIHYKIQRFHIGAKIDYVFWFNEKMMAAEDSDELKARYLVTEGLYVNFCNYMLSAKYELLQKKSYILLPYVKMGAFWENSIHPQKNNFGKKWATEIGFENQVFKKNHFLWIKLKYLEKRINPKQALFFYEKHHFYALGAEIGIGFWMRSKKN